MMPCYISAANVLFPLRSVPARELVMRKKAKGTGAADDESEANQGVPLRIDSQRL